MHYSSGDLFTLIRLGRASSRADLVRLTGLSPSTVAGRVAELIEHGFLVEAGEGESSGGRRPRLLQVSDTDSVVVGIDLGETHATVVVMNRSTATLATQTFGITLEQGPQSVCTLLYSRVLELSAPYGHVEGIAISVPGPVDARTNTLLAPTRMPGWNGVDVASIMSGISEVPTIVENDANSLALAELANRREQVSHLLYVKAGSGIGCGIVADGEIYRGYRGVAGDISHVSLPDAPPISCSCGRVGCLDVVASGSAIIDELREEGVGVETVAELLTLARNGDPTATGLLRTAGQRLGGVLATIVNFFNPQTLVLGGLLATADAFIAGIRQEIFTQCLPMTTDLLEIAVAREGGEAAEGVARRLLEELLTPSAVNESLDSP